jgi:hypothetical protein
LYAGWDDGLHLIRRDFDAALGPGIPLVAMALKGKDGEKRRGRASGSFSNAERRRGARDIEKRTDWLTWPLFRWTGERVRENWPRELAYRPASEIITQALNGCPFGLYGVHLKYAGCLNPTLAGFAKVTPRLVATTLAAIEAARRYPRELPRRVGNLEVWCSLAEQRLQRVSRTIESANRDVSDIAANLPALCAGESVESALDEYFWANGKASTSLGTLLIELVQEFERLEAGAFHTVSGVRKFKLWRALLAGLIGRAWAFCSPQLVFRQTINWLVICREAGLNRTGEDVYAMLATSLDAWFGVTGWQKPNLERMLEALPRLACRIPSGLDLSNWSSTWRNFVLDYRAVGSLGTLDASHVNKLLQYDLLGTAAMLFRGKPSRLKWLAEIGEEWLSLSARLNRGAAWRYLFSLGNDQLVRRLLDRLSTYSAADSVSQEKAFDLFDDVLTVIFGCYSPIEESESVLLNHFWLYDEFARRHRSEKAFTVSAKRTLELVGVWASAGNHNSLRSMAQQFLDQPFDCELSRPHLELCAQLAANSHDKFLRTLRASSILVDEHAADAADGWVFLHQRPAVRQFLIASADRVDLVPRIWRVLSRLALALRLKLADEVAEALQVWTVPPVAPLPYLSPFPVPVSSQLTILASYRILAGESEPLAASIREILCWPERRREELERLRQMRNAGQLSDAARPRLEHLARETSADQDQDALKHLVKACHKELTPSKLRALEVVIGIVINRYWRRIGLPHERDLAAPEWDNALQIYVSLRGNRNPLRRLLREEARGNRGWIQGHPANVAFLEEMRAAGLDMDRWLAGIRTNEVVNSLRCDIYTENEPLRALQMGSLFSTCLGAGGVNAFAAVANVIELNKRVLYLKSELGAILGRRLIGLSRPIEETGGKPMLVAFRSYGSCDASQWSPAVRSSPWVKIFFDLHCARLAKDVGAEVSSEPTILQAASNSLPLFMRWYNDGPEPLDWWVTSPLMSSLALEGHRDRLALQLRPWFEGGLMEDREEPWRMEPFFRVLLWLGDEAVPLIRCLGSTTLRPGQWRFLERWAQTPSVRELLVERIGNINESTSQ